MKRRIFAFAFLFACFFQILLLTGIGVLDQSVWANQAKYVQTGDPKEFNTDWAYGHPGGPIIIGVALIHDISGISYDHAIVVFLTLISGFLVAVICALCYEIAGNYLWPLSILGFLSIDALFEVGTPPSNLAALLVVLLCLYTLFLLLKNADASKRELVIWSLLAGLSVSTRVDIGSVAAFVFLLLLKSRTSWRRLSLVVLAAFGWFCLFDPFMWFMPVRHIRDLFDKIFNQYANFAPYHMSIPSIILLSSFVLLAMFLGAVSLFSPQTIKTFLPRKFIVALLAMTAGLYAIFMTADYQAPRYFLPPVLMWEVFLPVFLFALISRLDIGFLSSQKAKRTAALVLALVLLCCPIFFFGQSLYINYTFHTLGWQH